MPKEGIVDTPEFFADVESVAHKLGIYEGMVEITIGLMAKEEVVKP